MEKLTRPEEIPTKEQIREEIWVREQKPDSPYNRKRVRELREELTIRVVLEQIS